MVKLGVFLIGKVYWEGGSKYNFRRNFLIFSKHWTGYWTIGLLHWSLDRFLFYAFFLPRYFFIGSSTIQCYKLISFPWNSSGIVITFILFYLTSYFLILRWVRNPKCYNLIIWYKGGIKNGLIRTTYNIWWN